MTGAAPAAPGRPMEGHRYECRTCQVRMSTDAPTPELVAAWRSAHRGDGHELVEEHDAPGWEPCTGLTATWCPNCGDCTCPVHVDDAGLVVDRQFDADRCPLHGLASVHA